MPSIAVGRVLSLINFKFYFILKTKEFIVDWRYKLEYVFYSRKSIIISCALYACSNKPYACVAHYKRKCEYYSKHWPLKARSSLLTESLQFFAPGTLHK